MMGSERQGRLLEALVRRSSAPQRLVKRAQMILLLAAGKTFNQVARALRVLRQTVYKWGKRWRRAPTPSKNLSMGVWYVYAYIGPLQSMERKITLRRLASSPHRGY
jgi:DNA invertase Pin-like site-specific DNA recombinase